MLEKLPNLPDYNLILFDWLTFTIKTTDLEFAKGILGMQTVPWEQVDKYMNGYPHRLFFGGISICYGASEEMGVCVNMSGQGCRSFESYGHGEWLQLLNAITGCDDINITRLDVAYDDHIGLLDIDRLRVDTDQGLFISKSRKWKIEYGSDGTTLYFGSNQSNMVIRIYDKAAERGYPEDVHWIRCELQMRDKIAQGYCYGLLTNDPGTQYRGVLANYLRFVDPSDDSNKSRWSTVDYWAAVLDGVSAIRVWSAPGVDYNMEHLENYVVRQAGSAIDVYLKVWGVQRLIDHIRRRNVPLAPKYKQILTDYGLKEK